MDPVSKAIVSKIVSQITDSMFGIVKRHFGYLTHYKEKIQKLEAEIEELKGQRNRIQGMVNRARDDAEVIEDDVSTWLIEVERMEEEVEKFLADKVKENKLYFKCTCPDFSWRHQLGKGAQEKKTAVVSLKDKGSKFDTVAHSAPYPQELQFTFSKDYVIFYSRALVFNGILEALKNSRVNVIGIHGPGGVGKTTMVEEAAKQAKISELFREIVIVAVPKDADVRKIQEQLGLQLNLTYKEDSVKARAGQLWNRLKAGNKDILVILDDVWETLDCKAIGIPTAVGDKGCKVVLTSRNEDVCRNMGVEADFSIGFLPGSEAWTLFSKVVGDFHVPQSVAEKVCRECGGLPVAIVVVGAALKRKEEHVWNDALNQLENAPAQVLRHIDPKIYTSLQWSYDMLRPEDAKSCFLLCCLFPEDAEISIDELVWYCMALRLLPNSDTLQKARDRVHTMVDILKSSYLLLHGRDKDFVKMHDIIRDVAISIAKGKQKSQVNCGVDQLWSDKQRFLVKHGVREWPKKVTEESYSAVSLRSRDIKKLPDEPQCPELHTLVLECGNDQLEVPDRFFHGMKMVKVLDLIGIRNFPITLSLANLEELRMLRISGCNLRSTAIIKNLKDTLEILILRDDGIEDRGIRELPAEIGELTRLRVLDLEKCGRLEVIPEGVISSLLCLEELYFPRDFWTRSPTANKERRFAELKVLTQLTTLHVHIPTTMLLPKDFPFENLTRFNILMGCLWNEYDGRSTRKLTLSHIRLKDEFNGLLDKVELLKMLTVEVLKNGLNQLGSFSKLTVLHVSDCLLKYLFSPSCARGIQLLQTLEIKSCHMMEAIVGIEGKIDEKEPADQVICFSRLKCIRLKKLLKLVSFHHKIEKTTMEGNPSTPAQSLFNEQVVFPALEELEIDSTPNTEIWGNRLLPVQKREAESFCQLRVMNVSNCDKLVNVFPSCMLHRSQNLEILSVEECTSVISLVEGFSPNERHTTATTFITALPRLRELKLIYLSNLMNTALNEEYCSHGILVYPNLTTLVIRSCPLLRNVFSTFVARNLLHLKELSIKKCPNVDMIISKDWEEEEEEKEEANEDIIVFPQLRTLELEALQNLKSFCAYNFEAQALFNHKVAFPTLEVLEIREVTSTRIWDKLLLHVREKEAESFCQLRVMNVRNCDKLVNVFPSYMLHRSQNLQKLSVQGCTSVISLMEGFSPKERPLKLTCLPNVMDIGLNEEYSSHRTPGMPNLTKLVIDRCDNLRNVFLIFIARNLVHLQALYIQECPMMDTIISEQGEKEEENEEEEEANDDIIVFPQLKTMELRNLKNLKSFYTSRSGAKPIFNHQVAFPKLEDLSLSGLESSREIQLWHVLAGDERNLDSVKVMGWHQVSKVMGCHQVSTIVSPHLMQRMKTKLNKLVLENCGGMRQVFDMEGLNHDGELGQRVGPCVEVKILVLCSLPELRCLWNKDPHGILALHNLRFLAISRCSLLRNLFTPSVAMALEQLDVLFLTSCEEIEEVVTNKGEGEGEGEGEEYVIGEIIFPNLTLLGLTNLPNLKSFCSAANYAFKFPSLQIVVLRSCPKMHTFTSRQVSMRQISLYAEKPYYSQQIEDLNEYLEQRKEFGRMEKALYNLYAFIRARCNLTNEEMDYILGLY